MKREPTQSRNSKRKALYAAKAKESPTSKDHRNSDIMAALGDPKRVHVIPLDREDRKALRMNERVYIDPMKI